MNKTNNVVMIIIVLILLSLFMVNSLVRVSQGQDKPSRGIIMEWILR